MKLEEHQNIFIQNKKIMTNRIALALLPLYLMAGIDHTQPQVLVIDDSNAPPVEVSLADKKFLNSVGIKTMDDLNQTLRLIQDKKCRFTAKTRSRIIEIYNKIHSK